MIKKTLLILMALAGLIIAIPAHAHHDWTGVLEQLDEDETKLNRAWQALSQSQRNALRQEERQWVIWKDSLDIYRKIEAIEARTDYLRKLIE